MKETSVMAILSYKDPFFPFAITIQRIKTGLRATFAYELAWLGVFSLVRMISSLYFPLCCFILESSCLTTISKNTDEAMIKKLPKQMIFNSFILKQRVLEIFYHCLLSKSVRSSEKSFKTSFSGKITCLLVNCLAHFHIAFYFLFGNVILFFRHFPFIYSQHI